MTLQTSAQSGRLKDAILKGVYDDNLRMESQDPATCPSSQQKGRKNRKSWAASLSLFVLVPLLLGLYFDVWGLIEGGGSRNSSSSHETVTQIPAGAEKSTSLVSPETDKSIGESLSDLSYILRPAGIVDTVDSVELNTDQLLDYSLILNDGDVSLSSLFGLDVQTIVIDPGHGGKDPGAIGAMGTREKDIVLSIALGLRDKLQASGRYKVVLTRETDITMSLADRVKFANSGRTDLFISLHINALPQEAENLIETYYYGPPSDEETLRVAQQENRGSGVLTREFENMIKKIGNTFKEQESATLATAIQHSLFTNVKKYDKDIADAGIKIAPFVVLLGVDAPSVLVEISCISKKQEELKLNLPAYRDEITSFIAEGTIRYLAGRNVHALKGEENGQKERNKSS